MTPEEREKYMAEKREQARKKMILTQRKLNKVRFIKSHMTTSNVVTYVCICNFHWEDENLWWPIACQEMLCQEFHYLL